MHLSLSSGHDPVRVPVVAVDVACGAHRRAGLLVLLGAGARPAAAERAPLGTSVHAPVPEARA